ncbi:hypothetical protein E2C01_091338 [Portunus trituberculatus]|uniref:Uncharacterized protein n=1 Tax=Portunus trituberculatus TaxID=210409 RepID=A0A5B7JH82_PORTR|nr:hypothetical protein [Portunus trituberculatus]
MDYDSSCSDLPPPPTLLPSCSKLSITTLHLWYVQIKISISLNFYKLEVLLRLEQIT